jgi:hypothetical protein
LHLLDELDRQAGAVEAEAGVVHRQAVDVILVLRRGGAGDRGPVGIVGAGGDASATASKERLAAPFPVGAAIGTRRDISLSIVIPVELEITSTVGDSTMMVTLSLAPDGTSDTSKRTVCPACSCSPVRFWPCV